jgi:hypothetical protein
MNSKGVYIDLYTNIINIIETNKVISSILVRSGVTILNIVNIILVIVTLLKLGLNSI